jgi:Tol biopolymer transport system component
MRIALFLLSLAISFAADRSSYATGYMYSYYVPPTAGTPWRPCWSPDGKTIDFMLHSRIGRDNQPPVLYRINKDGSNLQALFSFPGLENAWFGTCSPDGKELVLSIPGSTNSMENGLYVINRISGHSKQILSNFFASIVRTPQEETP